MIGTSFAFAGVIASAFALFAPSVSVDFELVLESVLLAGLGLSTVSAFFFSVVFVCFAFAGFLVSDFSQPYPDIAEVVSHGKSVSHPMMTTQVVFR